MLTLPLLVETTVVSKPLFTLSETAMNSLLYRVPRLSVLACAMAAAALYLPFSGWATEQVPAPQTKPKAKTEKVTTEATLPDAWVKTMTWRSIGPANMGGRITSIAVYEADPCVYWIATASGGLLKTVNNGVTFEHQFDREATVSVGDVCVAPSNKDIVWVGTGENNPRNSVSYGDGVYKSIDGGKTWRNMGLKKSFQVGKIIVHPRNPNIVYVGALGRLYGPHEERGLYKTVDGGNSWERILYVDDKTGVIDMRMHPTDPETLLVATWERQRDGYDSYPGGNLPDGTDGYDPSKKWGPGTAIYKTTDGGATFRKVTKGLPTVNLGRIGLDYYQKNPNVVMAIVDCEKIGMGTPPRAVAASTAYVGFRDEDAGDNKGARLIFVIPEGPASEAGLQTGDIITRFGDKPIKTSDELQTALEPRKPKEKLKVQFLRETEQKEVELTIGERPAGGPGGQAGRGGGGGRFGPGGGTKTRPYAANYGGQRENIQDQQGPDSFQYGGLYKSSDGGDTWTRINSVNPRPMYFSQVRIDPQNESNVYVCGINMYRSRDGGKTFRSDIRGIHADQHALWINPKDGRHMLVGCDGGYYVTYDRATNWDHLNHMAIGQFYHVAVCSKRPYYVYGGLQDNGSWGGPSVGLKGSAGPINEDWISTGGGDGYVSRVDPNDPDQIYWESQDGGMGRIHLKTGERAQIRPARRQGEPNHRFNWNTPYILSNHNSKIFYCGGEYVFRSLNKGDDLRIISPEITRTKQGSATALAESPRNPEVLWVGTDDGYLWVTRNGGKDWTNVTAKVGLAGPRWVATIEASRFVEGRAYVAFDGHRSDDDAPQAYVTEDFGQTWKSIRGNLPTGSTRCLREDVTNPDLLYLGSEFAVFASINRGDSWTRINNNLPTVAIHEIAVHPTAGEIVAATHGRSLWILEVAALRQMKAETLKDKPTLYKPNTVVRYQTQPSHGGTNRRFVGTNPPAGAQIYYSLPKQAEKVSLTIYDIDGTVLRQMQGPATAGLQRVSWDLARAGAAGGRGGAPAGQAGGGRQGGQGRRGGQGQAQAQAAQPPAGAAPAAAAPAQAPGGAAVAGQAQAGQGRQGGPGGRGGFGRGGVAAGAYRVVLNVDGQEFSQSFRVEGEGVAAGPIFAGDEDEID